MGWGDVRAGNYGKFEAKNTKSSCEIFSSWKEMVFE
jgi:hypothetical protein